MSFDLLFFPMLKKALKPSFFFIIISTPRTCILIWNSFVQLRLGMFVLWSTFCSRSWTRSRLEGLRWTCSRTRSPKQFCELAVNISWTHSRKHVHERFANKCVNVQRGKNGFLSCTNGHNLANFPTDISDWEAIHFVNDCGSQPEMCAEESGKLLPFLQVK